MEVKGPGEAIVQAERSDQQTKRPTNTEMKRHKKENATLQCFNDTEKHPGENRSKLAIRL